MLFDRSIYSSSVVTSIFDISMIGIIIISIDIINIFLPLEKCVYKYKLTVFGTDDNRSKHMHMY